jgi:carboxypeptidase family protein/TonB-dependent receptor-like protein
MLFLQSVLNCRTLRPVTLVIALSAALSTAPVGFAQTETASIGGRVTDASGGALVGADVEIKNVETNVTDTTKTNGEGLYVFPSLSPGHYLMTVGKPGFKTVDLTGLTLYTQDKIDRNFTLPIGAVSESITVTADQNNINTTDGSVSTVIDRNFVESLPLNGRSFNMLLQLTPGVVIAPLSTFNPNNLGADAPGQFSIGGQRSDANNFTVDGVSANFGISSPQSLAQSSLGQSGLGGLQAMSALGGTSSLVSVDALEEFRIETSSFAPEFGRSPGGQVILTTRSGENQLHGAAFEYFRNNVLDANDWFAKRLPGSPHAPERHNDFGGVLGGPIRKDKTFFFFSYEGARLRLPNSQVNTVPSTFARSSAPAALAPFLDAFPEPNGQPASPTALTAAYTGVWSNQATLDAASLRIDHNFSDHFSVFARYNYAPSQVVERVDGENRISTLAANVQTGTVGANMSWGRVSNTVRFNYSTQGGGSILSLDSFGGAVPPPSSLFLGASPPGSSLVFFTLTGVGTIDEGQYAKNRSKQFNIVDTIAISIGSHALKFGGDYRLIDFDAHVHQEDLNYSGGTIAQFLASGLSQSLLVSTLNPGNIRSQALSLFAQDTWKITPRLTATYGLRWELDPAPASLSGAILPAFSNTNNPAQIAVEPAGSPLWKTTYGNLAPRLGLAYRLTSAGDLVLRAGGGIYYDLGSGIASQLVGLWPNSPSTVSLNVPVPISSVTPFLPPPGTLQPPYGSVLGLLDGFASNLKLPRSYQWNWALEKSFAGKQVISATYVGQSGADLLRSEAFVQPNANFATESELELTGNSAHSSYQALELQYRTSLTKELQALFNYTWSHSIDNASSDNVAFFSNTLVPLASTGDKGNSDFDVRHSFSGGLTYSFPSPRGPNLLRYVAQGWFIDGIIVARSGFPFNAVLLLASPDPTGFVDGRPDRVPGQPLWISAPTAPGGKMLNVTYDPITGAITGGAFAIPSTVRQGNEGRNDIPGFGLTQVDFSLGRNFHITERINLQFRTDAFNLFNHPNFTNPDGFIEFGTPDLQSSMMLNNGLGGLSPLFQEGGPRSLQLSLKLTF